MKLDDISNLFDSYSRVARLYPALLTIVPVFWTIAALNPSLLVGDVAHAFGSFVVFFGGMTLIANVARSRGKSIEPKLMEAWGGWRTTVILRHRDATLDKFTKERYHARLQKLGSGLTLPTVEEEAQNAEDADAKYRSATKRLIEKRREPKYSLLHKENGLYGFRRNLLGLKPVAIFIIVLLTLLALGVWLHGAPQPIHDVNDLFADATTRWPLYVLITADLLYLLLLLIIVRPYFVLQAADEYALALFRTLE